MKYRIYYSIMSLLFFVTSARGEAPQDIAIKHPVDATIEAICMNPEPCALAVGGLACAGLAHYLAWTIGLEVRLNKKTSVAHKIAALLGVSTIAHISTSLLHCCMQKLGLVKSERPYKLLSGGLQVWVPLIFGLSQIADINLKDYDV